MEEKYIIEKNDDCISIQMYDNDLVIGNSMLRGNTLEYLYINVENRNISYGRKLLLKNIEIITELNYDCIIAKGYDIAYSNFLIKNGFELKDDVYIIQNIQKKKKDNLVIKSASIISMLINIILVLLKIVFGSIYNINSLIVDGINSAADCFSTILVIIGIKISNTPEDDKHPFGYGKIESVFSVVIASFMILSTLSVIKDNIFSKKEAIIYDYKVYIISILLVLIKIFQFLYIRYIAKKYNSIMLLTLIKDYYADILMSLAVLSVIIIKKYDLIISSVISIYLIYQAIMILIEHTNILLDRQDKKLLKSIKKDLENNEIIFYIHDLFMINSNNAIYIYADARVNKDLSIKEAHEKAESICVALQKKYNVKRITLHLEPIY